MSTEPQIGQPQIGQSAPAGSPVPPIRRVPDPGVQPAGGPGGDATPGADVPPTDTGDGADGRPRPVARPATAGGVVVGRIVEVAVVAVHPEEVEVRLADGRIGVIPRSEFEGRIELGGAIEAALLARDDPKRRAVLSKAWAERQRAWERVEAAATAREPLTGSVIKAVKGGAVVDLGLRAFLPTSLFPEDEPHDPKALVGREVEVLVLEADRASDRVVVSIRDLQRRRRRHQERELLRTLEAGARVRGAVVSTSDHGAVVDLGGVRGLVHRSELTWGHLGRVDDVVCPGDEVEVVVLDVNRSKRRISLSLRATSPDPFDLIEAGLVESSTVTRVVDYGAFVRLDSSGAEGLVHISELSDVPGYRPDQLVAPGEQVMVKVLEVDRTRRRLTLSVRRVLLDG
jgi:small subunit ribosomal protein S1